MAIEGIRVQGVALPFHPISRPVRPLAEGRSGGRRCARTGGGFLPPALLPPLGTMAQQSVTRVTGRRSGCHHKTFQLVIANINVATPGTRALPCGFTRTTRRSHTPVHGTRARVPGTRTLLFPLSAGWKTTTTVAAAASAASAAPRRG